MSTFVPLIDFPWQGEEKTLAQGVTIRRRTGLEFADDFDDELRDFPRWVLENANLSLEISSDNQLGLEASQIVQLFLFSLWIVSPTNTRARFRFVRSDAGSTSITEYLDHFHGSHCDELAEFTEADLDIVEEILPVLAGITEGRIYTAIVMAIAGCESVRWKVSYLCHAASLETLLTYESGHGITRRLAEAYSCLVEDETPRRNSAFQEFSELYGVRSDIIHGQRYGATDSEENLALLVRFQELARTLWRVVLSRKDVREALNDDDQTRKGLIRDRRGDWKPQTSAQRLGRR